MSSLFKFSMSGDKQLVNSIARLGKLPQRSVTKAAGKGTNIVRNYVKSRAPVMYGDLKGGIVRNKERSSLKGKAVYEVVFDSAKNDIFQKPIKNPGAAGGKSKYAYYPSSMEFGFLTRSKGGGLSYVPGYHFMRDGAAEASGSANSTMLQVLQTDIDKELGG